MRRHPRFQFYLQTYRVYPLFLSHEYYILPRLELTHLSPVLWYHQEHPTTIFHFISDLGSQYNILTLKKDPKRAHFLDCDKVCCFFNSPNLGQLNYYYHLRHYNCCYIQYLPGSQICGPQIYGTMMEQQNELNI